MESQSQGTVIQGDCLEVLKTIQDNYFDSLLIDSPAGISFMQGGGAGKDWDRDKGGMLNWINWLAEILTEANRTMKPGAVGLVWSIPRTSHWTGMAIELAGFKIIDICHHANGAGFPKAQDISTHIDRLLGAEREVIGKRNRIYNRQPTENWDKSNVECVLSCGNAGLTANSGVYSPVTAPATPEAKYWDGWKTTALKPAIEGWWLIQKKISETSIARNVLKHGVGGLNIESARVGTGDDRTSGGLRVRSMDNGNSWNHGSNSQVQRPTGGRYPANLVLSCSADCDPGAGCGENGAGAHAPDCPVSVIGAQSGVSNSNATPRNRKERTDKTQYRIGGDYETNEYGDKGTAARFFKQFPFDAETVTSIYYQAKASKSDRTCNGAVQNVHPTVKSRYLIGYFLKLITPPGGIVLDCFGGSGTTAVAAIENGFRYYLIEKEPDYVEIINQRIAATGTGKTPKAKAPTIEEPTLPLLTDLPTDGPAPSQCEETEQTAPEESYQEWIAKTKDYRGTYQEWLALQTAPVQEGNPAPSPGAQLSLF